MTLDIILLLFLGIRYAVYKKNPNIILGPIFGIIMGILLPILLSIGVVILTEPNQTFGNGFLFVGLITFIPCSALLNIIAGEVFNRIMIGQKYKKMNTTFLYSTILLFIALLALMYPSMLSLQMLTFSFVQLLIMLVMYLVINKIIQYVFPNKISSIQTGAIIGVVIPICILIVKISFGLIEYVSLAFIIQDVISSIVRSVLIFSGFGLIYTKIVNSKQVKDLMQ